MILDNVNQICSLAVSTSSTSYCHLPLFSGDDSNPNGYPHSPDWLKQQHADLTGSSIQRKMTPSAGKTQALWRSAIAIEFVHLTVY